jgi:mannonate dehydratase
MIEIAEMLPPEHAPDRLWRVMRQAGVRYAVGGLPPLISLGVDERPWDYLPLLRLKQQYESFGFRLMVLESRPPYNLAKRGLPGRDDEIAAICTLIENMGRLGIPVWCYEWMADFNWLRTDCAVPSRGASLVSGFNYELLRNAPSTPEGPLSEAELWTNLQYFLQRVVPVAEKWNVKLAMHPDDPPVSPIRGVGRIMRSVENYQRLLDLVPSPANGITLCQGNFRLMTDDLPALIRRFGRQAIHFVHMRDVRGTAYDFQETWHDDGPTDLLECLRAYRDIGYDGVLRPDHVPTVDGDSNDRPGYSVYGRLFAVGYLRGLQQAVYDRGAANTSNEDA